MLAPDAWKRWIPAWVWRIGPLAVAGLFAAGVVAWGGFNWTLELTNTEAFCISCHEITGMIAGQSRQAVHYSNRPGFRDTCADCHVPKDWGSNIIPKFQASNE